MFSCQNEKNSQYKSTNILHEKALKYQYVLKTSFPI